MNLTKLQFFFITCVICTLFTSCIKDEAENAEADIITCSPINFTLMRAPVITNNSITIYANDDVNLSKIALAFTVTPGAKIIPLSGTELDFSKPQIYTVYSEDGKWSKQYTVSFIGGTTTISTKFDFEDTQRVLPEISGADYQVFFSKRSDGTNMEWGSGNYGFSITNKKASATQYPTFQSDNGYIGKCAELVTRSTGTLGALFGYPIAAGNLFIGTFDTQNVMETIKATHFGIPFKHIPDSLKGYYKYKPGNVYRNKKNQIVKDKVDTFDIYAVFYESTENAEYLDGTNSLTSPNIALIARLEDRKNSDDWTYFSIPFNKANGKDIDMDKLFSGKYNITLVMSSSIDGANFNGAVGSTLLVDEVELVYDKKN